MPETVRVNLQLPPDEHGELKACAARVRVDLKALLPALLVLAARDPTLIERAVPIARGLEAQGDPWMSRPKGRRPGAG
jgi:hypothetical protein